MLSKDHQHAMPLRTLSTTSTLTPPRARRRRETDASPTEPRNTIDTWLDGLKRGWPEDDVKRMVVCGFPRWFNGLPRREQHEQLNRRPAPTHTRWDALIAGMAEHLAELHDHPIPEWVNEPDRFLETTWVLPESELMRLESLWYAPPAFIRHGAIPDPADLDARGGERYDWIL